MGKLIKNHLARLICLAAGTYQAWGAFMGFFWPKIFFDFATLLLNPLVKPVPILQTVNLCVGLFVLALEWPLPIISGTWLHRSFEARLLVIYPIAALLCGLMYQTSDPCGYYIVGMAVWFWAYAQGEVVCKVPWTLPKRGARGTPVRV